MADMTYINQNSTNGQEVMNAINHARAFIATLEKLDGLRAECIGKGQSVMAQNFGVTDANGSASNDNAQDLSDRWGGFLAAYNDANNTEFAKMRDFLNATTYTPA